MTDKSQDAIFLHRDADVEGHQLCAMTTIAKKLGYTPLTDIPREVDPGLAALVNLLNDRANDRARQLLIAALDHIPNTGRTEICDLIGSVYLPQMFGGCGVDEVAYDALHGNDGHHPTAKSYQSLGMQFLEPDGRGDLGKACLIYAAALNADDPAEQDVLAVSAVSQIVTFETGDGWFELLYILEYMLGQSRIPSKGGVNSLGSLGDFFKYFGDEDEVRREQKSPEEF
jgi:hypothetical protein